MTIVAVVTDATLCHVTRGARFAPSHAIRLAQALAGSLKLLLACAVLLLLSPAGPAQAHDVPGEFRAHALVKPEAARLQVLVRVPLSLLLNIDLPKKGPGYIDLAQADAGVERAAAAIDKVLEIYEDDQRLSSAGRQARISPPSDRAFDRFDSARDLVQGPKLPDDAYVFWNQGYFDTLVEYPIRSDKSRFSLRFNVAPGLKDRLKYDLRYIEPDGAVHAYDLSGETGLLALDPRWYQAASTFIGSGFRHILDGPDHLLFLLCLILPFRRIDWNLAGVITAFTVGHSITLIAAAYHFVPAGSWFAPLVEFLIAASILYMAVENVLTPNLTRRWLYSGLFGLVHGFGFSFILQSQLQFAGSHLLVSLLAFNVGIEIGQLLVLVLAMSLLTLLYRSHAGSRRPLTIAICLFVGHTAWHWMGERGEAVLKADWPGFGEVFTALSPFAAIVLSVGVLGGLAVLLLRLYRQQGKT